MAELKLVNGTSRAVGITNQSVASGASYNGLTIDNATNKDAIADVRITYAAASAPSSGKTARVWIQYSFDGGSTFESYGTCIWALTLPTNTSTYTFVVSIELLPLPFRFSFQNVDAGVSLTATIECQTRPYANITS